MQDFLNLVIGIFKWQMHLKFTTTDFNEMIAFLWVNLPYLVN